MASVPRREDTDASLETDAPAGIDHDLEVIERATLLLMETERMSAVEAGLILRWRGRTGRQSIGDAARTLMGMADT